jgi:hypothetical protein
MTVRAKSSAVTPHIDVTPAGARWLYVSGQVGVAPDGKRRWPRNALRREPGFSGRPYCRLQSSLVRAAYCEPSEAVSSEGVGWRM